VDDEADVPDEVDEVDGPTGTGLGLASAVAWVLVSFFVSLFFFFSLEDPVSDVLPPFASGFLGSAFGEA
jgi:hypothetical protein